MLFVPTRIESAMQTVGKKTCPPDFKHINNAETKTAITRLVESCGYACPQLCSPEELGEISND
jgi:hypothetical protein